MKSILISILIAALIGFIFLGAFIMTGLGLFILLLIALAIFIAIILMKVIKNIVKIGLIVLLVFLLLFFFNTSFNQKTKLSCSIDNDCRTGGTDLLNKNNCVMSVNKNYYTFFVNKKDSCVGNRNIVIPKCIDKKCSYINMDYCKTDNDCICGGKDSMYGTCFVGNIDFYNKYVNKTESCPDFCTGIAGNLQTKCINNVCSIVNK
ncbi:MAG: hypothetical protein AABW41_04455 [Nanoarchaeota archaeon]